MPRITIEISEQMEAKVADCIRGRKDFIVDGGKVLDGERLVFLKEIRFSFLRVREVEEQSILDLPE